MRGAAARCACVATSLTSGLALFLYLAICFGGVSLGPFEQTAARLLSDRAGLREMTLDGLKLARAPDGDALTLSANEVSAEGADGGVDLPDLALRLAPGDVMRGRAVPRHVALSGASLEVVRTERGFAIKGGGAGGGLLPLLRRAEAGGFEGVEATGVSLRFRDEVADLSLQAEGASVLIEPTRLGYKARLALSMGEGRIEAQAAFDLEAATFESVLTLNSAPLGALLPYAAKGGKAATLPLTGEFRLGGGFHPSAVSGAFDLRTPGGVVELGPRKLEVEAAQLRGRYEGADALLAVDGFAFEAGRSRGALSGEVRLLRGGRLPVSLRSEELVLALPGFEAPLAFGAVEVTGGFEPASRRFAMDEARLALRDGPALGGQLAVDLPKGGDRIGVVGGLSAAGPLSRKDVLALWPTGLAPGARRWTQTHVEGGRIEAFGIDVAIPRGHLNAGGRLTPEMLDLRFALRDGTIAYLDGMPPVTEAAAEGHLTGGSFEITATSGRTGGAAVERASFALPRFGSPAAPAEIAVSLRGAAQDLLALADAAPFGFLGAAGLSPDDFGGEGRFVLNVTRPLRDGVTRDEMSVAGEGTFERASLDGLPGGFDLTAANGTVTLSDEALVVEGEALARGVPATGRLERRFGPEAPSLTLEAAAALTPASGDALGLPVRRYVAGSAPLRFAMAGEDRFEKASIRVDLTPAALRLPDFGVAKAAGARGRAAVDLYLPKDAPPRVQMLKLVTEDVLVEGSALLDEAGGLVRLDLPRVFVAGHADLAARLARDGRSLDVDVTGRFADAVPLIDRLFAGGGTGGSGEGGAAVPMTLTAAIDEVKAKGGVRLKDVRAAVEQDEAGLRRVDFESEYGGGGALRLSLGADALGVGQKLSLTTDSTGDLVDALFGISSLTGGSGRLDATVIEGGPVAGTFAADALTLRDAPVVARLLSIGSLDGLANVLSGEGLYFDRLRGAVTLEDGVLGLQDARLTGSALGLSANGAVDLSDREFDLSGAVAPAYGVNSFLGAIPLLGDLLVSREGEGVVAFAYGVEGPIGSPTISVNTLSALTPGIFRRLFEPVRDRPSVEQLLARAQEEARLREDRETAASAEALTEAEGEERRLHARPPGRSGTGPGGR